MKIQAASLADAEEISALIIELSDPFYVRPSRIGAELFLESVSAEAQRSYLSASNFLYYVAKFQGGIAGVIALRDNSHLFHLFVAKPFQGMGLSSRLWRLVKSKAREAGNLGEFTVNSSLNAVVVYEKFGFVPRGDIQNMHGISFQPMHLKSSSE
jgi:GNAT superfamily N-acetyltransferase